MPLTSGKDIEFVLTSENIEICIFNCVDLKKKNHRLQKQTEHYFKHMHFFSVICS